MTRRLLIFGALAIALVLVGVSPQSKLGSRFTIDDASELHFSHLADSTRITFAVPITNLGDEPGRPTVSCGLMVGNKMHHLTPREVPVIAAGQTAQVGGTVVARRTLGYRILDNLEPWCEVPVSQTRPWNISF